jgi:hypothetical protein
MRSQLVTRRKEARPAPRRVSLAALLAAWLIAGPALAGPPPPPPPVYRAPPPPVAYYPAPVPHPAPPPLPIAMRVIYAPFYAAGLVLRYGVYYLLVAPFEVLGRTLDYGVEGGVERDPGS